MSFLQILNKIVLIGEQAAPIIIPLLTTVFNAITSAEQSTDAITTSKKQEVMSVVISHYAASGVTIDPVLLSVLIDNLVEALNRTNAHKG